MGILRKIFGRSVDKQERKSTSANQPDHAVIVHFKYGIEGLYALNDLELRLEDILGQNAVGEYDGHEIATDYSDGFLYLYGPDAEILFNAVLPALRETHFMRGATAKLRFGPPEDGIKEIEHAI